MQCECIKLRLQLRKGGYEMKQWTLKRLRDEAGLTQKMLAEELGMSDYSYMRKENGQTNFYDYEMFKISKYFNKPIEDIFLNPYCNDIAITN